MDATFKRRDLHSSKSQLVFGLFITLSLLVFAFFLLEEFQTSYTLLKDNQSSIPALSTPLSTMPVFLQDPASLSILILWLLSCVLFAFTLNRRVKAMFKLFLGLSSMTVILFNFWIFFIHYTLEQGQTTWVQWLEAVPTTMQSKVLLLLFWSFFSIFTSFALLTAKYLGIFSRLNYLFQSISRGNWDASMFFRKEDKFSYIADSFNRLKERYLREIYSMEEELIHIKDFLDSPEEISQNKESFLKSLEDSPHEESL